MFYYKLQALLADIMNGKIFGNILACVYTIEFQKRGLPHAHMLFVLDYKNKLSTAEMIDKYISAEIHMLHGLHTDYSACYNKEKNECSKKFSKQFRDSTEFEKKMVFLNIDVEIITISDTYIIKNLIEIL